MTLFEDLLTSVEFIRDQLPSSLSRPPIGIICGSGLGGLADTVRSDRSTVAIEYSSVPGFSTSTGEAGAEPILVYAKWLKFMGMQEDWSSGFSGP